MEPHLGDVSYGNAALVVPIKQARTTFVPQYVSDGSSLQYGGHMEPLYIDNTHYALLYCGVMALQAYTCTTQYPIYLGLTILVIQAKVPEADITRSGNHGYRFPIW